jgi:hypothetical protein
MVVKTMGTSNGMHTANINIPRTYNIRRKVGGINERIPPWVLGEFNEDFIYERYGPRGFYQQKEDLICKSLNCRQIHDIRGDCCSPSYLLVAAGLREFRSRPARSSFGVVLLEDLED